MIQITATTRWIRTKFREGGDWVQVDCFCFTAEDGTRSYADGLWPEQQVEFARQEAERAAAGGDVNIPALGTLDALIAANGF